MAKATTATARPPPKAEGFPIIAALMPMVDVALPSRPRAGPVRDNRTPTPPDPDTAPEPPGLRAHCKDDDEHHDHAASQLGAATETNTTNPGNQTITAGPMPHQWRNGQRPTPSASVAPGRGGRRPTPPGPVSHRGGRPKADAVRTGAASGSSSRTNTIQSSAGTRARQPDIAQSRATPRHSNRNRHRPA